MAIKHLKKPIPLEEVARLIEEIAERVETKNYAFDNQVAASAVGQALLEMRHLDGVKLINHIALLLNTENGKATTDRYGGYIQKRLAKIPPLDPIADSAALRALAAEIAATASKP